MLSRLVELGIVLIERAGPSYLYRTNRGHLAAPRIIALAGLRAEPLGRLRALLARWDPPADGERLGFLAEAMTEPSATESGMLAP